MLSRKRLPRVGRLTAQAARELRARLDAQLAEDLAQVVLGGGANDAIRALLDLAPPKAVVIRDGEPVELPTAEVQVGDLLLVRPGAKVPVDAR